MVPEAGLEPARCFQRDFKSLVSTNFTTRASDANSYTTETDLATPSLPLFPLNTAMRRVSTTKDYAE